ncbi:hypothetical protein [Alkalihalobacillus sp. AL-G]|uniref:hypothetical protein n=1 Tax=Alkalihalobacillus sp. AL-G TaxID=2926399 RepID=UPI00272AE236|nr:hypothetical protein [Alkalihalobacillus sp. AL-G]WLD92743.1 hypothetical protein MOJ78_17295 [Alkalihalobacillus sp. AL-G]
MEVKNMKNKLSPVTKLHATGLLMASLGILILYLVGLPGFPRIPPGPIILGMAGILVIAIAPQWKWILIISVIAALFVSVGGIIEGSSWGRLAKADDFGPFIGTAFSGSD